MSPTRTALVTGGGRNIGRACVLGLAEDGFNVAINGSSDKAACEKVGVHRWTVTRWRKEDPAFEKEFQAALTEGEALVNDLTENQLLGRIHAGNFAAGAFWLRHRHPKFREKIDITARIEKKEELTPEQQEVVRKALQHAALLPKDDKHNYARSQDANV